MAVITNFNRLVDLREAVIREQYASTLVDAMTSKAGLTFMQTMLDSLPALFDTALLMNARHEDDLRSLTKLADTLNDLNNVLGEMPEFKAVFPKVELIVSQYKDRVYE